MSSSKKQPNSTSVSNLLFRLWLLFLAFILVIFLSFPSLTKLRMQSYYSTNFSDIFNLLEIYLQDLDKTSLNELFDRLFIVSGISINYEKLAKLNNKKLLNNNIKVKNFGSKRIGLSYYSAEKNYRISFVLEAPIKQYTMAVMYLLINLSDKYGYEDKKILWKQWKKELNSSFEVSNKMPTYLTMAEKHDLNSHRAIWTLDNLNQLAVIYKYENLTYLSYGKIKPFNKYPLNLMLFMISMVGLLISIGLGLILKKINKDLFLIYQSAIRIFKGEEKISDQVSDVAALDAINKIFEEGNARLEKARREQQELVAAVSHELRTPLARLLFSIQLIEDAKNLKEVRKHTGSMEDDVEELNLMVDEILTYNKLDKTGIKLHLKPIDLEEISQNVIDNLYTLPEHSKAELIIENPLAKDKILADAKYIQRAIHNLVTNANRYAQTKIFIRLVYFDKFVDIIVEDDGIGIPEKDRDAVFSPFVRLDNSRNRSSGGYGLGLSIVSKVVLWHKACVKVTESKILGGAKFLIRIAKNSNIDNVSID